MKTNQSIHELIQRYEATVEQLRRVAHYHDRAVMGRAPTASEAEEFARRNGAKQAALRKVCTHPCPDFAALRAKALCLDKLLAEDGMSREDMRLFARSILQMGKKVVVE